jgi:putative tryptophan/tyrosine transport system substrate-binding protein
MPSPLCCAQRWLMALYGGPPRLITRHCMIEQRESAVAYTRERNMRRREFLSMLGTAAALPAGAQAQKAKRMPRLCFLTFDPGTLKSTRFAAFFQTLRELGYVDGQSITIDYLSAEGDGKRFSALAAECLRLNADIIAVSTTPATEAAKNAT